MKPGDRINTKKTVKYDIKGTIKRIEKDQIWVSLDSPLPGSKVQEGFIDREQFDEVFDIVEKTDWASLWDESAE